MAEEEKSFLERELERISGIPASFSNPNSAAYRQRKILEKRIAGEPIPPQEAAYTARSGRPTVKELMDLSGASFSDAGSAIGRISAFEQDSKKLGQPNRLLVDYNALRETEAFKEDPMAALAEVGRQLAATLAPKDGATGRGQEVGGSGIIQLRGDRRRVGFDTVPYLRAYIVNPESGVLETQTGLSSDATMDLIRRRGYQLSQDDIDSLKQQAIDFYGDNRNQQLLQVLDMLDPIEYDRPDIGNVIMAKASRGGGLSAGYNYLGEDPLPYVSMDEYFSGLGDTASEQLMAQSPTTQPVVSQQVQPMQPVVSQQVQPTQPVQPQATDQNVLDLISNPFQTPGVSMANTMANYYDQLYSSPYFSYYGTPYMFENVFNQGVYNPQGSNQ